MNKNVKRISDNDFTFIRAFLFVHWFLGRSKGVPKKIKDNKYLTVDGLPRDRKEQVVKNPNIIGIIHQEKYIIIVWDVYSMESKEFPFQQQFILFVHLWCDEQKKKQQTKPNKLWVWTQSQTRRTKEPTSLVPFQNLPQHIFLFYILYVKNSSMLASLRMVSLCNINMSFVWGY